MNTRTSHILLIDDSLSMGLSSSGRTAFQHALDLAAQAVEDVGPKDRFTLVLSSRPESPLLREVDLADPNEALNLLRTLQPTETSTSWASTLSLLDKLVQSSTFPTRTVTIITDLRRVGWEDEVAAPASWANERVQVRIIDVGGNSARQLVARPSCSSRSAGPCRDANPLGSHSSERFRIVDGKPRSDLAD